MSVHLRLDDPKIPVNRQSNLYVKQLPPSNLEPVDLTPLTIPEKLAKLHQTSSVSGAVSVPATEVSQTSSTSPTGNSRENLSQQIKPPAMVQDPNENHDPESYIPVQPFVLPCSLPVPPSQTSLPYLDEQSADNVLKHKLKKANNMERNKRQKDESEEFVTVPMSDSSDSENLEQPQTLIEGGDTPNPELDEDDGEYIPPPEDLEDEELDASYANDEFTLQAQELFKEDGNFFE